MQQCYDRSALIDNMVVASGVKKRKAKAFIAAAIVDSRLWKTSNYNDSKKKTWTGYAVWGDTIALCRDHQTFIPPPFPVSETVFFFGKMPIPFII